MGLYDDKTIQRFWSKVKVGNPDECWIWQGSDNGYGYGHMATNVSRHTYAHRIACYLKNGVAPQEKSQAMHSCDVRLCCNPDHLKWGSNTDNSIDCATKGRASAAKLTPQQVLEIRALRKEGKSLRYLGKIYGVNNTSILKVTNGTAYTKLEESKQNG